MSLKKNTTLLEKTGFLISSYTGLRSSVKGFQQGALLNYKNKVLSTFGNNLIAYWPLNDENGAIAKAYGPTPQATNFFTNPSFLAANNGWRRQSSDGIVEISTTAGEYRSNGRALKVTSETVYTYIEKRIVVTPGEKYTLDFWIRGDGVSNAPRYAILDKDYTFLKSFTSTTNSTTFANYSSGEFTVPAGSYFIRVWVRTDSSGGEYFCIDDFSLIKTGTVTINDLSGHYVGATLSEDGIDSHNKSVYFNGTNGSGIPINSLIANEFPLNNEGTLLIWEKIEASALIDGVQRFSVKFKTNATTSIGAGYTDMWKDSVNNRVGFQFNDGVTGEIYKDVSGITSKWICRAITWSKSNGVTFYVNGSSVNNSAINNDDWADVFDGEKLTIGAENIFLSGNVWHGWLSHCALGKTELSAAQILKLSTL